jgi:hypothetical protein
LPLAIQFALSGCLCLLLLTPTNSIRGTAGISAAVAFLVRRITFARFAASCVLSARAAHIHLSRRCNFAFVLRLNFSKAIRRVAPQQFLLCAEFTATVAIKLWLEFKDGYSTNADACLLFAPENFGWRVRVCVCNTLSQVGVNLLTGGAEK